MRAHRSRLWFDALGSLLTFFAVVVIGGCGLENYRYLEEPTGLSCNGSAYVFTHSVPSIHAIDPLDVYGYEILYKFYKPGSALIGTDMASVRQANIDQPTRVYEKARDSLGFRVANRLQSSSAPPSIFVPIASLLHSIQFSTTPPSATTMSEDCAVELIDLDVPAQSITSKLYRNVKDGLINKGFNEISRLDSDVPSGLDGVEEIACVMLFFSYGAYSASFTQVYSVAAFFQAEHLRIPLVD